jgi:hypothetical protein
MADGVRRLIVTPEQLKEGWIEFRRDGVPNTIQHGYRNAVRRSDGNWEVDAPQDAGKGGSTLCPVVSS